VIRLGLSSNRIEDLKVITFEVQLLGDSFECTTSCHEELESLLLKQTQEEFLFVITSFDFDIHGFFVSADLYDAHIF